MNKIKEILELYEIKECSFKNEFEKYHGGQIDGLSFVLGFFNMLTSGINTLEYWAGEIFKINGNAISSQALQGKLQFRHQKFAEEFLKKVLRKIVLGKQINRKRAGILSMFSRVFIEDSTCLTLPPTMFEYFPGTVNQAGVSSTARIQFRMELKSGGYTNMDLKSYRDNDQSYSENILSILKKGDLVLRDLGYWSIEVFRKIIKKEAFLISRHFFQTKIFDPKTEQEIPLYRKLRSLRKQGVNKLDISILLGKDKKLPMRLIAIRVPQQIEQRRKREMRSDKLKKRTKDYLEMLGWCIYITNIEQDELEAEQVQQIYYFRWRIEIIFKCWKSKFNLRLIFDKKKKMHPSRIIISFYLLLIWLTLFFAKSYNFFLVKLFEEKGKLLSLFKFANFFKENFRKILQIADQVDTIKYLARYCIQNKRSRKSDVELIYLLKFS